MIPSGEVEWRDATLWYPASDARVMRPMSHRALAAFLIGDYIAPCFSLSVSVQVICMGGTGATPQSVWLGNKDDLHNIAERRPLHVAIRSFRFSSLMSIFDFWFVGYSCCEYWCGRMWIIHTPFAAMVHLNWKPWLH